MENTDLIYMTNDTFNAFSCNVLECGIDEIGHFAIFDKTIGYPGGGGQEKDDITLKDSNGNSSKIFKVNFNNGFIKYYFNFNNFEISIGATVAMLISRNTRKMNSALHTVGHWLSSLVVENLMLDLFPTKGFHYKEGAYVEFSGNESIALEDLKYAIEFAMKIDIQAKYSIESFLIQNDAFNKEQLLLPDNFRPMTDRPLRIVKMENYKGIPCGGTHLKNLSQIKSVIIKKVKRKNGKIRVSYDVDVFPELAAS